MRPHHLSSSERRIRRGLLSLLCVPAMLALTPSAAEAADTFMGAPIEKCADGTVVFTGTTGPFNPNDPSADPCANHGGSSSVNGTSGAIPVDAEPTVLVCRDASSPAGTKDKLSAGSTATKSALLATSSDDSDRASQEAISPRFTQTCDTFTVCANGELKCGPQDQVSLVIGFPEITSSDVTVGNIGTAHNILADDLLQRLRSVQKLGAELDAPLIRSIVRRVALDLLEADAKATLSRVTDLDQVAKLSSVSLATGVKEICGEAGATTKGPGCSASFVDLMTAYSGLLETTDPDDFDGVRALLSDLDEDAEDLLSGDELASARVFSRVYRASMTYWQTQDVTSNLRASDVDARTAALYYVYHVINGPYPGDLEADSAVVGAIASVFAVLKVGV